MKAAGLGFEEVTPSDVLLVDWDEIARRHIELYEAILARRARA